MTTVAIAYVNFAELCQCVSISEEFLIELIEHEVIKPITGEFQEEWQFNVTAVSVANKAKRIHHDLVIDWADIPLVLSLLEEIDELRAENNQLKQRLGRFLVDGY
jgi:chaperone modulatory protein CbpM